MQGSLISVLQKLRTEQTTYNVGPAGTPSLAGDLPHPTTDQSVRC